LEVRSKRHGRVRVPFDCERGMPHTEAIVKGIRVDMCGEDWPRPKDTGLKISGLLLHKLKLVRYTPWLLQEISTRLNIPSSYTAEDYTLDKMNVDTLIVGGGTSGIFALRRTKGLLIANDLETDVLLDPMTETSDLANTVKQTLKSESSRILKGDFLGKFSEGYLLRVERRLILVNPSKIIFATGGRYLPPIFEGNDLPHVISRRLYLRRRKRYNKVLVLGSSDDAVRTAIVAKGKVLTPEGVKLFSRRGLELIEEHGVEVEEVKWLRVKAKSESLEATWDKGQGKFDAIVFSPVKQPRVEPIANSGCAYKFYPNMGIYLPEHDMDGYMKECNHYVTGGGRGIWWEELSALSGTTPFDPEAVQQLKEGLKETTLRQYYTNDFITVKSPYLYGEGGYMCLCEDVTYEDIMEVVRKGYVDVEAIKRTTGLATGMCQGKACSYIAGSVTRSNSLITFRSPLLTM
jgi:BFD-like [2Fe-2S] binding domain.